MKIVAISVKGQEFLYKPRTAHKVSNKSANYICAELNRVQYKIDDNHVWHIHEVDEYDDASVYAEEQSFTVRKGGVYRKASPWAVI